MPNNAEAPASGGRSLIRSVFLLGTGEGLARACNLAILIILSRRFGIEVTGAYVLGQTLNQYIILGTDLGLPVIGARLAANYRNGLQELIGIVQGKRLLLALTLVPLGFLYGRIGPVPQSDRTMVSLMALSIFPYALSCDWVVWGLERFTLLGFWRSAVSIIALTIVIVAFFFFHAPPATVALANGSGYLFAAAGLWWYLSNRGLLGRDTERIPAAVRKEVSWGAATWMGLALFFNQAFNSIDSLMMGALSNAREVGLYSAAYRVLILILTVYYLCTRVYYPRFAQMKPEARNRATLKPNLIAVGLIGIGVASAAQIAGHYLLLLLYGRKFVEAEPILRVLLWALPFDFVTSFSGMALNAWGRVKRNLIATSFGVAANMGLNLILIPRYQAMGAAWATILSYVVLVTALLWAISLRIGGPDDVASREAIVDRGSSPGWLAVSPDDR